MLSKRKLLKITQIKTDGGINQVYVLCHYNLPSTYSSLLAPTTGDKVAFISLCFRLSVYGLHEVKVSGDGNCQVCRFLK